MDRRKEYYAGEIESFYEHFSPWNWVTLPMQKPWIQAEYNCHPHPLQRSKLQTFQRHLSSLRGVSIWYWNHNFLVEHSFNLQNHSILLFPTSKLGSDLTVEELMKAFKSFINKGTVIYQTVWRNRCCVWQATLIYAFISIINAQFQIFHC